MIRKTALVFLGPSMAALMVALSACTPGGANHTGNPVAWPFEAARTGIQNQIYNTKRGAVEVFVKSNHPALIEDIRTGGGPRLTEAYDLAEVPATAREFHSLRLQSELPLYAANPGALVVAIMVASP